MLVRLTLRFLEMIFLNWSWWNLCIKTLTEVWKENKRSNELSGLNMFCNKHEINPPVYLVWRRQWHPTPVLLPGKSRGQRSLVGGSPWGHEESDMTERLHFHFSLSCIGEGNGNPLQCSCLENPRDGGAWWAAVYGVTELDTTEAT